MNINIYIYITETFLDVNRVQDTQNANRNLGFRVGVKLAEDKYTKARNIPGCKSCTEYTECEQEPGVPGRGHLAEDKYTKARNIPGCKPCTEYTECEQEAGSGFRVPGRGHLAEDKYTKARNIPGCKPCTEYTECGQEAGVPGRGQTGRGQIHKGTHTYTRKRPLQRRASGQSGTLQL